MPNTNTPEILENRWFINRIAILFVIFLGLNAVAGRFYFIVRGSIYPTVHTIMEFVSIIVAMSVSLMSWYEYRYKGELRTLLLSAAFCAVGLIDFAHTLSYIGMPYFINANSVNKASIFWIVARIVQAVGILAATIAGHRLCRIKRSGFLPFLFAAVTIMAIYYTAVSINLLPPMYDNLRHAQTPLKIHLEYAVIALMLIASGLILKKEKKDKSDLYLTSALLAGIMSELAFTFYSDAYDVYNLLGHGYKIITFAFILMALVDEGLSGIYQSNEELGRKSMELAEMNRQLRLADKIKNDFLANTNHELKTPLSAIVAFTELLLDEESTGGLNGVQRDYLKEINDSGSELMGKIKGLLELSGILGGKVVLHQERINVHELVTGVTSDYEHHFRGKDIHFNVSADAGAVVFADRDKLSRLIANLLDNALKFTGPGGTVEVSACQDRKNRKVRIRVSDTGVGIEPEQRDSIFEMFYQADGSSTRQYGGTGIGLTLAARLAEINGGKIELESERGRGSAFTVVLPLHSLEEVQK